MMVDYIIRVHNNVISGNLWNVIVYTSDVASAGTDAVILLVIYGDKAAGGPYDLDTPEDDMERGFVDYFQFYTPDIGIPYMLNVESDNTGEAAGWHLNAVIVYC
jgi:hypothetical protein